MIRWQAIGRVFPPSPAPCSGPTFLQPRLPAKQAEKSENPLASPTSCSSLHILCVLQDGHCLNRRRISSLFLIKQLYIKILDVFLTGHHFTGTFGHLQKSGLLSTSGSSIFPEAPQDHVLFERLIGLHLQDFVRTSDCD